jgi:carbamoyl-phosphate synthase/aspartate carbamoyltransferase
MPSPTTTPPTATKPTAMAQQLPFGPVTAQLLDGEDEGLMSLELEDGAVYQGYSFGAQKSVAGELVFQTGMVGYPESITDPSYRGQILVITFPLVGNYGVPSRDTLDDLLKDLPAHFESSQIHIAGLITSSYTGEDYSHYLATSSLGSWLKEQGIPAVYGVDTRALTKRIRTEGSMLGRMLLQKPKNSNGLVNGAASALLASKNWRSAFETIDWVNPNEKNLVADGEFVLDHKYVNCSDKIEKSRSKCPNSTNPTPRALSNIPPADPCVYCALTSV